MATAPSESPSHCKVLLGKTLAKPLLAELREGLRTVDRSPLLVSFLASSDPAAREYAESTGKTCRENGFQFELREVDREELEDAIILANNDDKVDGILVYYPVFGDRQDQYLQNIVDVGKDVEGLTHQYIFNMYQNIRFLDDAHQKKSVLPCTPLACLKILEELHIYNPILSYGNRLHGHTITVINRSEVVGRPLAALLANDGARVYSVDINDVQEYTRGQGLRKRRHTIIEKPDLKLEECLPLSDVVISGVPGDNFKVPVELLREGAVCINFSSQRNFDKDKVKERASIYVPAIGAVTIAVLLRNLLRIVQNRAKTEEKSFEAGKATQANGMEAEKEIKTSRDDAKKETQVNGTDVEKEVEANGVDANKEAPANKTVAEKEVEANGNNTKDESQANELEAQKEVEENGDGAKKDTWVNGTEAKKEIEVDGSDVKKKVQANETELEKKIEVNGDDAKKETQANGYEAEESVPLNDGEAEKEIQENSSEEQNEARRNGTLTKVTEMKELALLL